MTSPRPCFIESLKGPRDCFMASRHIKVDLSLNPREKVDPDLIKHYEEILEMLPPVVVMKVIDDSIYLVDGFHRFQARLNKMQTEIRVQEYEGTWEEAVELAIRLNTSHGKPLSRQEKNKAAESLLALHPDWTDCRIGRAVGCSHNTASKIRYELQHTGRIARIPYRTGAAGQHFKEPERIHPHMLLRRINFPTLQTAYYYDETLKMVGRQSGSDKIVANILYMCADFRSGATPDFVERQLEKLKNQKKDADLL